MKQSLEKFRPTISESLWWRLVICTRSKSRQVILECVHYFETLYFAHTQYL